MKKILTIARREYQAMVATKAFLIGLAMLPILMLGGMYVPKLLKGIQKSEERKIAVIDRTGQLFDQLNAISTTKNELVKSLQDATDEEAESQLTEKDKAKRSMGMEDINTYVLEQIAPEDFDDKKRLELSEKIRNKELHGFMEIPADLLEKQPLNLTEPEKSMQLPAVTYASEDSAISDVKGWLRGSLTQLVRAHRMSEEGISPALLLDLERQANIKATGLYEQAEDGTVVPETKPDELTSIFLPMGIMMLMFMVVMMSAQPMLESVLEEKTLRISEVLLGAANAKQLLLGKLLGNVGGSLTIFGLYAIAGVFLASNQGKLDVIPMQVIPFFLLYQMLAVLLFSSVFMVIGASVSQLREAQSFLLPVWMVMMLPLMVWMLIVRDPNSVMAVALSLFPPSAPMTMVLRLATGATIPYWQIIASCVMLIVTTMLVVVAASRLYRVAILYQGKTPKVAEMLSWVVRDPAKS